MNKINKGWGGEWACVEGNIIRFPHYYALGKLDKDEKMRKIINEKEQEQ